MIGKADKLVALDKEKELEMELDEILEDALVKEENSPLKKS